MESDGLGDEVEFDAAFAARFVFLYNLYDIIYYFTIFLDFYDYIFWLFFTFNFDFICYDNDI